MSQVKTRRVTFISRFRDHELVMEPAGDVIAGGRIVGTTPGSRIKFTNGRLVTDDQAVIDFLRRRLGEPDAPAIHELDPQSEAPDPTDTLVDLATANAEQTRRILDAELDGWERPKVIEACNSKLAQFAKRGPKTD